MLQYVLRFVAGKDQGREFPLPPDLIIVIGRAPNSRLRLEAFGITLAVGVLCFGVPCFLWFEQVLFGNVNPSGKLPVTIPASANQVPTSTTAQFPGVSGHVSYSEGLLVGYRWFDANNVTPLFPFGFGLSYTTFGYSNITAGAVSPSGQVQIGFDLTNTGGLTGTEVPQLYLGFSPIAGEPPSQMPT